MVMEIFFFCHTKAERNRKNSFRLVSLLWDKGEDEPAYFCGGVLASNKQIITGNLAFFIHCIPPFTRPFFTYVFVRKQTAATCFYNNNNNKSSHRFLLRDILIVFGGHDLNKKFEVGRFITNPTKIHTHSTYSDGHGGDLAVLEFDEEVPYGRFIQPICLWDASTSPTATSGWIIEYDRTNLLPRLYQISMSQCSHQSKAVVCGKVIESCDNCQLNRGNGLFMKIGNAYFLRGITLSSQQDDHGINITFIDVLRYKEWISSFDTSTDDFECGVMSKSAGLVQGNQFSLRDQFPWMVSIVFDGGFHNNGALVSDRHVITYVETVASWNKILGRYLPDELSSFKIYLGSIKYNDANKPGAVETSPSEILLHPYVMRIEDTPINSIAIVILKKSVEFSRFIKPICIWDMDTDLSLIEKSQLYGVGYGKDETGHFSGVRKHAKVSLQDMDECKLVFVDALDIFNETKLLCVKGSGKETPCFRDTPLFVKFNDKWYLRGVLLRLRFWTSNGTCILDKPLLYEDISQNSQWILSQIKY